MCLKKFHLQFSAPALRPTGSLQKVEKGLFKGHHEDGHHNHKGSKDAGPEWHVPKPRDLSKDQLQIYNTVGISLAYKVLHGLLIQH